MTPHIEKLKYPTGATIVRQGEPADRFYVICDGEVEVIRERPTERDLSIARLGENEYFGEIGLMTSGPRVATVRALSDVTLLAFDPQAFRQLIERSESDRQRFDAVVRERIEQLLDAGLEG
ncbi:MAG TPA: cyclic nucleotide-binding domain-containing protein [Candidatus Limnocylindria bacterium]|nr:cyclic nucleotide-binding domain-containing protein [Candidatus Limnocylindria bacterium]